MSAIQQSMLGFGSGSGGSTPSWRTAFDQGTASSNSGGWSGYTMRTVIDKSLLGGSATKLRITFLGGFVASAEITKSYVQIRAASGDAYDFASTPAQVLFSGSANATLAANTQLVSDEVTLSIDGLSDLVVSVYSGSTTSISGGYSNSLAGTTVNGFYTSGDDAATVNSVSGQAGNGGGCIIVKLELYG